MPVAAWLIVGAIVGVAHVPLVLQLAGAMPYASNALSSRRIAWMFLFATACGGATGIAVGEATSSLSAALLVVVSSVTLVQTPLDLLTRRLSRLVTLVSLIGVVVVLLLDGTINRRFDDVLISGGAATGVTCVYAFVHRATPMALGWGDVLLVAPLTLAVGAASLQQVVIWQLVASASAAVHGVISRLISGGSTVAFGPHLLLGAWLVTALSL